MISKDAIDQIRQRTDLVSVVREHVPTLKQRGRTWSGLCPFHNEKTPSFSVNPEKGFFYCFGCKKGGSVLDFVMEVEGLAFPEAVRSLAARLGLEITQETSVDRSDEARRRRDRDELYAVNHLAATFFETQLREHSLHTYALTELGRRSLRPSWAGGEPDVDAPTQGRIDDALQTFRVGYAPVAWDGLARFLKAQGVSLSAAESVGLVVPRNDGSGYFDRFRHRLMFPVIDPQGRVVAFSGRKLDPPPEDRRSRADEVVRIAKYINSPETPIYVKGQTLFGLFQARHTLLQSKEKVAVLVEGNFDVVSLHARGFTNVVGALGTAVTKDQMKLLRTRASSVIFLFDADDAGRKGVAQGRESCREVGLVAKVALIPQGKDPDELVRSPGGPAKLATALAQAKGTLEYMLDQLLDTSFVAANAYDRAERVQVVSKLLAEEDDPIVRSMAKAYADRLAGRLDLVRTPDAFRALEESVSRALAAIGTRNKSQESLGPDAESKKALSGSNLHRASQSSLGPRRARVQTKAPGSAQRGAIVGALIDFPELLGDPEVESALSVLEGPAALLVASLASAIRIDESGKKSLDTAGFLSQIPENIQAFASQRLAEPRHATSTEAKTELLKNANHLQSLALRQETTQAARSIEKVDGEEEQTLAWLRELNERHRAKHGLPPSSPPAANEVTDGGLPTDAEETFAETTSEDSFE